MLLKKNNHDPDKWIPELYYEEHAEGITCGLPFAKVPNDKEMPSSLFVCELREQEENESELTVHMYCNMTHLKSNLDGETLDKVRLALGLTPLKNAIESGKRISDRINSNVQEISEKLDEQAKMGTT